LKPVNGDTSFDVRQRPIQGLRRYHRNERGSECQAQRAEQTNDLEVV
jgi:hypothetical protein